MATGSQRKYDDHYELNFEVLQPPPKIVASDDAPTVPPASERVAPLVSKTPSTPPIVLGTALQDSSPKETPVSEKENPAPVQKSSPQIQIASTDEFASEEIKSKLHSQPDIPEDKKPAASTTKQVEKDAAVYADSPSPTPSPTPASEKARLKNPHTTTPHSSQPHQKSMATPYTSPTSSNYTRNVERQAKEQKSLNTILSGVGLFLLVIVLIFGATAGFGGYVLWKEIQSQQVTVNRLDEKYAAAISGMDENLVKTQEELSGVQLVIKTQRDELVTLKTQLAATATQLRATQKENEAYKERVAELERAMGIRNRTR